MDNEETFFLALKIHRESKGITLDDISEHTKINPKYLHAIEEGNFDILPNVYMRLFLRSYTKYIEIDSNQTLADYELYTTGKIQPKLSSTDDVIDLENQNKSFDKYNYKNGVNDNFQINYKQISSIIVLGLIIFLAFKLVSYISQEDVKSNVQPLPDSFDTLQEDNSSIEKILKEDTKSNYSLLNNLDFNNDNFYSELTEILSVTSPAILTIQTLENTKINIVTQQKNGEFFFLMI